MNFADKILPTQAPQLVEYFGTPGEAASAIAELVCAMSPDPRKTFKLATPAPGCAELEHMASSPLTLSLLAMLAKMSCAHSILEIGTFVGLGTMTMARACKHAMVTTLEAFAPAAETARQNFRLNELDHRITLVEGPALETIYSTVGRGGKWFDFVFIDGGKQHYAAYMDAISPMVQPGGLVILDDVFFNGDIFNDSPNTEKGFGVRDALLASKRSDFERLLLPIGDGVLIMRKK